MYYPLSSHCQQIKTDQKKASYSLKMASLKITCIAASILLYVTLTPTSATSCCLRTQPLQALADGIYLQNRLIMNEDEVF